MVKLERPCFIFAFLTLSLCVIYRGWVCDDAFISFRVVDNFVHGFGLRWNVVERVQTFTNPLWVLLHLPFHFVTRNIWLVTQVLSFCFSLSAILVFSKTFPKRPYAGILFLLIPFFLSDSLMDYTSSGLENPLTYLLFSCFGWVLVRGEGPYFWFWLSLITALLMVNRLDSALMVAPVLIFLVASRWRTLSIFQVVIGAVPFLAWELFSLWYYGFLFPNTKYAKLHTGIPEGDLSAQGFRYLLDLWYTDAPSVMMMVAAAIMLWLSYLRGKNSPRLGIEVSLFLGVVVTTIYIVVVGGDFMSGRFFSLPVLVCLWLIYGSAPQSPVRLAALWPLLLIVGRFYSEAASKPWYGAAHPSWNAYGIADERQFYKKTLGLFESGSWTPRFHHGTDPQLERELQRVRGVNEETTLVKDTVGIFGYYGGPAVTVVDNLGVTDPLLARLPSVSPRGWRIGHFNRRVPKGYLEALNTGRPHSMETNLATYYQKLQRLTRGNLNDPHRIKTILAFNSGAFDDLLRDYLNRVESQTETFLSLNNTGEKPVTIQVEVPQIKGKSTQPLNVLLPPKGFSALSLNEYLPVDTEQAPLAFVLSGGGPQIRGSLISMPSEGIRGRTPWVPSMESSLKGARFELQPWTPLDPDGAPWGSRFPGKGLRTDAGVRDHNPFSQLLFPWVSASAEFETELVIYNGNRKSVTLSFTARRLSGETQLVQRQLSANQSLSLPASSLFPAMEPGGFSLVLRSDNGAVSALWVTRNLNLNPGGPLHWRRPFPFEQRSQTRTFRSLFPFLPVGADFKSLPVMVNTGTELRPVTITGYDNQGRLVFRETRPGQTPLQPAVFLANDLVPSGVGNVSLWIQSEAEICAIALVLKNGHEPAVVDGRPANP